MNKGECIDLQNQSGMRGDEAWEAAVTWESVLAQSLCRYGQGEGMDQTKFVNGLWASVPVTVCIVTASTRVSQIGIGE